MTVAPLVGYLLQQKGYFDVAEVAQLAKGHVIALNVAESSRQAGTVARVVNVDEAIRPGVAGEGWEGVIG